MSNIKATKKGLYEKKTGRKIISPLDDFSNKLLNKMKKHEEYINKKISSIKQCHLAIKKNIRSM